MMWSRAAWPLGFFASLWMAGCHHEPATNGVTNATAQPAESAVRYVAVAEQLIADRIELSAKVQADPARMFRVFPPASGRVGSIRVKPGDTVTHGEMVATIDSADAASAQSDLTKAQIEAERAQRTADREKVLLDHGAVAEKDYSNNGTVAGQPVAFHYPPLPDLVASAVTAPATASSGRGR